MEKYAKLIEKIAAFEVLAKAQKVYGPYTMKETGRQLVVVVDENGKSRTVSYPKHILEVHHNRILDPDMETIDHLDSDFNNNDINNLRIVPRKEHSTMDTKRVKLIDLKCDHCGKEFQRSPRLIRMRHKGNASGNFCSRSCSGAHNRARQLGKIDRLPTPEYRESEYYKLKYAGRQPVIAQDIANRISQHLNNMLMEYASFGDGKVDWPRRSTINGEQGWDIWVWVPDNRYTYVKTLITIRVDDRPDVSVIQNDMKATIPQEISDAIKYVIDKVNDEYWYKELPIQQRKDK